MAVKRRAVESSAMNTNIWTIENELKLFKAALKYKPAGIMKHLNMALIYNELLKSGMREVTPATIWDRLANFYNLDAADKIEKSLPKLEESECCEFQLPKKDFQNIINETLKKSAAAGAGSETKETIDFTEKKKLEVKVEVKEPAETGTGNNKKAASSSASNSGTETPKSAIKRPLRSTPGSGTGGGPSAKRRK